MMFTHVALLLGLLALVPFAVLLWWGRAHVFVAQQALRLPTLRLLESPSTSVLPSHLWLSLLCRVLAACLLILAAANPLWLGDFEPPRKEGRAVMVLVDSSLTMTLEDLDPKARLTRMEATQDFLRQWIQDRPQNAFGLIVFGSSAAVLSEPTLDQSLSLAQLSRIQIGTLGNNTALGDALGLAMQALAASPSLQQQPAIVLVSDGEESNSGSLSPLEAVSVARDRGVPIHTIQFGAPVTRPATQPSLDEISALTGGRSWRVSRATEFKDVFQSLDALTPLLELPPTRAPSLWLAPWLVLASGLLALLGFAVGRDRTSGLVDASLRAWSLTQASDVSPWTSRLRGVLWVVVMLLCLLAWFDMKPASSAHTDLEQKKVVAILNLFEPSAAVRQAHRLALLTFSKDHPEAHVAVVVASNTPGLALPLAADRSALERVLSQLVTHRDALVERVMGEGMDPLQGLHLARARAQAYAAELGGADVLEVDTNMLSAALAPSNRGASDARAGEGVTRWQWWLLGAGLVLLLATAPMRRWSFRSEAASWCVVLCVLGLTLGHATLIAAELTGPQRPPAASSLEERRTARDAFDLGLRSLTERNPEAAIRSFERALGLGSAEMNQAAQFNLALAWSHHQNWDLARDVWLHYLKHHPDDLSAKQNLDYVLKRRAAAMAGKGSQTDLRGRRGTASMGEVQVDGYGATEADLHRADSNSRQGPLKSLSPPARAGDSSDSAGRRLSPARTWPMPPEAAREASMKLDRLADDQVSLFKGLLAQPGVLP